MPELELCEGARVLLTHNLAVEHGLMNDTQGVLQQIVFVPGGGPDAERVELRMPEAVVVDFPGFAGPRFYDDAVVVEELEAGPAAAAIGAVMAAAIGGDAEASEAEAAPAPAPAPGTAGAPGCRCCRGIARPSTTRASREPSIR